jgi:hypothetical protein
MKYSLFSFLFLLLLNNYLFAGRGGCSSHHSGHGFSSSSYYSKSWKYYKPHDGFVILKNSGDTLYGSVLFGQEKHWRDCVALTKEKGKNPIYIRMDSIKFVRLYDCDTSVVNTPYTDYKVLNNDDILWRLIGKGKVEIYDNTLYCNESSGYTGDKLRLADGSKITKASYKFAWDTKADLLRCMNKRYGTHFERKDFKDAKQAMQYLVDRG